MILLKLKLLLLNEYDGFSCCYLNSFFSIFLFFIDIKVLAATADERNVIKDQVYVLQQMQSDRLKVFFYILFFILCFSIINNNFFDNRLQQMNKQD